MIVKVKKAKIFVMEENTADLLLTLQKNEIFMATSKLDAKSIDVKEEQDIIVRATNVLEKLSKYMEKKPFFDYFTVPYEQFINEDEKRLNLLSSLENNFDEIVSLKDKIKNLSNELNLLNPFKNMNYITKDLNKTIYVSFIFGFIKETELDSTSNFLKENSAEFEKYELTDLGYPVVIAVDKDNYDVVLEELNKLNFNQINLPSLDVKVIERLDQISELINNYSEKIAYIETELKTNKTNDLELKILIDQLTAKIERMTVGFLKTEETVYIEGYVREDMVDRLHEVVKSVTTEYDLDITEPGANEEVPTATKNNTFVKNHEVITNMYSVPSTNDVDPNPVMSVWYFLIFGIMMGDVGYGLLMVVLLGLFIKLKKPKGTFSQLVHVLYYAGYTSIFAGIIFGSVFGFSVDFISYIGKIFGQDNWKSFSMMDNILTMLVLSIGIGVLHLTSGLVLKVKVSLKHNDILTALADGFSWIFILVGGSIAVIFATLVKVNILMYVGLGFVAIGFILILALAGREKKGAFSKVASGLGGLYNSANYLSDLLSYSRILALALSSAVIAETMNTLAALVQGNFVGIIFSVLIYLIGHTFNFAMGMLSAYVHDSRLQYIEFFGKFYEGGGTEFMPLKFDTKHINEITY